MQVRGKRAPLRLGTELSEGQVLELAAGDVVYLTGRLYTMRDQAHLKALQLLRSGIELPFDLKGGTIYHCGPLMRGDTVVSAGPTTSMRMERSEPEVIARTGLRAIVGKGGMGQKTAEALVENRAVYMEYPGGVGALAARASGKVRRVFWRELGDPEAVWEIPVKDFGPCFVTMDAHGGLMRARRQ
jgi:fumarate hydratase subunit beta